jgi:hypothetical protein
MRTTGASHVSAGPTNSDAGMARGRLSVVFGPPADILFRLTLAVAKLNMLLALADFPTRSGKHADESIPRPSQEAARGAVPAWSSSF